MVKEQGRSFYKGFLFFKRKQIIKLAVVNIEKSSINNLKKKL